MACDKVPLLAPSGTTITLGTNSAIVQPNGTARVTATLIESAGTPVQNGTTVTFSTNLGRIVPAEARTTNGVATVEFQGAGTSGVAEIRATSGAAKPADAANSTLKISVGAAAAGRISVTAAPSTVSSSGGTSTISASVVDTAGNALRDVPVTFSTTAGTLSTTVANADQGGVAQTTLTTNREATVTASVGGAAGSGATATSAQVVVRINATGTVTVAATPSPASVGQPVSVSVTLAQPASGGTPWQRSTIDFGDGTSVAGGPTSNTYQHTYTRAGTFVIRATAFDQIGDNSSGTATLVVNAAPKPTVTITPVGTPAAGTATNFTLTVTPAAGTTIQDVRVDFGDGHSYDLGAFSGTTTVQNVYAAAGTYTVTATASDTTGVSATGTAVVVVPFTVTLSTSKAANTATFTANVNPPGTSISSYFWVFGDGQSQTTTTNSTSHTYVPGTYQGVSVTATGTNGQAASSSPQTIVIP
jgi:hypothetical protein